MAGSAGFGVVRNLRLENASIEADFPGNVGAIAGFVERNAIVAQSSPTGEVSAGNGASAEVSSATSIFGMIVSSWSSAKMIAGDTYASVGGLAGSNGGTILNSYATGEVSGGSESSAGGLIGDNGSSIVGCFATGRVHGGSSSGGGLVGYNAYIMKNSYAEGDVSDAGIDGTNSLGGLIGFDQYGASLSYSTGKASGGMLDSLGGTIGVVDYGARYHDVYWDTTSRGVSQGAGNLHDKQLEALTSNELRSGLPTGFAKSVWKQKPGINSDFPYLIPNQPPK